MNHLFYRAIRVFFSRGNDGSIRENALKFSRLKTVRFGLLALFVCLTPHFHVLGQGETDQGIRGFVRDGTNLEPLAGAEIVVLETRVKRTSQVDGTFEFAGLAPSTYSVEVKFRGYVPQKKSLVTVYPGGMTEIIFELEPNAIFLSDVVVAPSHYSVLKDLPEPWHFLSQETLNYVPHFAEDLSRALAWVPGTSGNDFSAKLHIRGGQQDEILVVLDGLEIYEPFHLKDFDSIFCAVDPDVIGGIDILTGGFPSEYGGRMSGVMDISLTQPSSDTQTSISASFISAGVKGEGAFADQKGRWLVSLRQGYIDLVMGEIDEDSRFDPTYYDALTKVEFQLGERNTLSSNVLVSNDEVDYIETDDMGDVIEEDLISEDTSWYGWLNLRTAWSDRLYSESILSTGSVARHRVGNIDYFEKSAHVSDDRSFDFFGLKLDWTFDWSARHYLKWGIGTKRLNGDYDYESHSIIRDPLITHWGPAIVTNRDIQMSPSGTEASAYFADRFQVTDPLVVEMGLRWDRYSQLDEAHVSPRFNMVYSMGQDSTIRAAWGQFRQAQRIDELQITDGVTHFHPAEMAEHRLISFEKTFETGINFKLEVYQKLFTDVAPRYENIRNQLELFPEVEPDRIVIEPTSAEARGMEILMRKQNEGRFNWWISYIISSVEDEIDGEMVPRSWDEPTRLTFGTNYRPNKKWNINLSGVFHTGWPMTEVTAEFVTLPGGYVVIDPTYETRNAERYPDYFRLDCRTSRTVQFDRARLLFFLEVTNFTNRDNIGRVEHYEFNVLNDGSVEVNPDYENWLPIIPSLGVKWTF